MLNNHIGDLNPRCQYQSKRTMMTPLAEDVCAHKYCAEEQRKSEVKRLGTDAGCEGYKKMGCYECQGRKEDCYAYTKMPKRAKS